MPSIFSRPLLLLIVFLMTGCTAGYYLQQGHDFADAANAMVASINEQNQKLQTANKDYLLLRAAEDEHCPVERQSLYIKQGQLDGLEKVLPIAGTEGKCAALINSAKSIEYRCFTNDEANCLDYTIQALNPPNSDKLKPEDRTAATKELNRIRRLVEPGFYAAGSQAPSSAAVEALGAYTNIISELTMPYQASSTDNLADTLDKFTKLKDNLNDVYALASKGTPLAIDNELKGKIKDGTTAIDALVDKLKKWQNDKNNVDKLRSVVKENSAEVDVWFDKIIHAAIAGSERYRLLSRSNESTLALAIKDEFKASKSLVARLELLQRRQSFVFKIDDKSDATSAVIKKVQSSHNHLVAILNGNLDEKDKIALRKVAFDEFKEALTLLKDLAASFS